MKLRAVVYRMSVQGKAVSQTFDFVRGDKDPGENQARSNLLAAVLSAGMEPTDDEMKTFVKIEVQDPHA